MLITLLVTWGIGILLAIIMGFRLENREVSPEFVAFVTVLWLIALVVAPHLLPCLLFVGDNLYVLAGYMLINIVIYWLGLIVIPMG